MLSAVKHDSTLSSGHARRQAWPVLILLSMLPSEAAQVSLTVLDGATGQPMPARVHLKDSADKPHRPERLPFWRDHFVCDGKVELTLPNGTYRYEIERGPEFTAVTNSFTVDT